MELILGNELSAKLREEMKVKIDELVFSGKRRPLLTVILVGDNPASKTYVASKEKACVSIGMEHRTIRLDGSITQEELEKVVEEQNKDDGVDGILVQLPLPKHLSEIKTIEKISPEKDVDGLHPYNAGCLLTGRKGFVPCTPKGIVAMLNSIGIYDLSGKRAAVVGRSNLVGKPISLLLQKMNATVTMVHSRTADAASVCKEADVLVAAIGKEKYINREWVKPGAVVIDVGINRMENGKLCGDVDFEDVKDIVSAISPVPKGVGPMTVCMLLANTLEAYERRA
ncbi:MAG: bifunctional methylenetetrahydrofolate dehydrogenase/methenyltetrahydrofolate cyclohydrolase FolD [Holdemanella sp.]|nr:bifunctional methylenetetrahydrofolate dehydrogenase/methenyltetrahydrofolate cyclohydrolase FolD [Holdemanella sp.]